MLGKIGVIARHQNNAEEVFNKLKKREVSWRVYALGEVALIHQESRHSYAR